MTFKEYIISSLLIIGAFYLGCTVTATISKRNQDAAIANAVSYALDNNKPVMTCKEQKVLDSVKALAENGVHMKTFNLEIKINNAISNIPDHDPWN